MQKCDLEQQQVLGHDLLGCHVRDARQRQHLVRLPGLEQRARQLEGVGGHDVVVGQSVDELDRPFERGCVGDEARLLVVLRVRRRDDRDSARCRTCRRAASRSPGHRRSRHGTRRVDAARRGRPGSRRSSSRGYRPDARSRKENCRAIASSPSTWSSRTGWARSPATARSHSVPLPGCASAVDDQHGEALVGEPLRDQVRVLGGDDPLGVWAAVGVEEYGQRRTPSCSRGRTRALLSRRSPSSSWTTFGTNAGSRAWLVMTWWRSPERTVVTVPGVSGLDDTMTWCRLAPRHGALRGCR